MSTAGAQDTISLAVSAASASASGVATCNEFDEATLRRCVQRAEEIARPRPRKPRVRAAAGAPDLPQAALGRAHGVPAPAARAQAAADSITLCVAKA
ncbi:MAG: hypothetical protein WKG07_16055 [Hymenobacter sp.]